MGVIFFTFGWNVLLRSAKNKTVVAVVIYRIFNHKFVRFGIGLALV